MPSLVFLLDVDNTLLANDEVKRILDEHLQAELGAERTARFWDIYEHVRQEKDVVDIPLSLKKLREEIPHAQLDDPTYNHVRSIFDNYPFFQNLYPHVLETLHYLRTLGLTVIVSDGDKFFQAEKIFASNLAEAVEGRVLLYVHKQHHLHEVMEKYPADHYVMIDDKPDILVASKKILRSHLTTVFVQQGKYAEAPKPSDFSPDISVLHIADLRSFSAEQFLHS